MMRTFKNETEFVAHLITRADNTPNTIVGMGVRSPTDCGGFVMTGIGDNFITGYFYRDGHFYDHFRIGTNFHRAEDGEMKINEIKKITDFLGYY